MLALQPDDAILVVGAHAFDAEVMAGGLAAVAAANSIPVTLLHLTLGEQGHRSLSPRDYAAQKREEALEAARVLGAEARFLDYQDTGLPLADDVALQVSDVIREVKPTIVVGHWRGSWHKDHQAAHRATVNGAFFAALPTLEGSRPAHAPRLLLFAENWEDAEGFRPQLFVDISSGHDRWMRAVAAYELGRGDLAAFPYADYYTSLTRVHGCVVGTTRAAAFMALGPGEMAGIGQFVGAAAESGT